MTTLDSITYGILQDLSRTFQEPFGRNDTTEIKIFPFDLKEDNLKPKSPDRSIAVTTEQNTFQDSTNNGSLRSSNNRCFFSDDSPPRKKTRFLLKGKISVTDNV